jgi:hypothetical protein
MGPVGRFSLHPRDRKGLSAYPCGAVEQAATVRQRRSLRDAAALIPPRHRSPARIRDRADSSLLTPRGWARKNRTRRRNLQPERHLGKCWSREPARRSTGTGSLHLSETFLFVHVLVVADLTEHIGEGFEHSVREIFLPMLIADSFVSGDYTARDCGLTVSTGVWCLPGSVDVRSAGRLSTARPATKQGSVAAGIGPLPGCADCCPSSRLSRSWFSSAVSRCELLSTRRATRPRPAVRRAPASKHTQPQHPHRADHNPEEERRARRPGDVISEYDKVLGQPVGRPALVNTPVTPTIAAASRITNPTMTRTPLILC